MLDFESVNHITQGRGTMETIHSNCDNPKRQHQASRLAWYLSLGVIKYCVPRTPMICSIAVAK